MDVTSGMKVPDIRKETDSLGEVDVPADKLWGAQTQRSLQHFSLHASLEWRGHGEYPINPAQRSLQVGGSGEIALDDFRAGFHERGCLLRVSSEHAYFLALTQ
jgi:hypothetical protein